MQLAFKKSPVFKMKQHCVALAACPPVAHVALIIGLNK
jgi:hypothetical protein